MSAPDFETVSYYRGRPLTDYSKEELIGIVKTLGALLEAAHGLMRDEMERYRAECTARQARH